MKAKKEKKDYDQNIGLHEIFLESVPTTLIIFFIFVKAGKNILIMFVTLSRIDESLNNIIFGDGTFVDGRCEFRITFSLSVFSASLGLSKCLRNGVARPIGDEDCLDGLLSCRNILAFFACGLCLVAKGWWGFVTAIAVSKLKEFN